MDLTSTFPLSLTRGCIASIMEGASGAGRLKPVVQVLSFRPSNRDSPSYLVALSDGDHQINSLLEAPLTKHIHRGDLQIGSIIALTNFGCLHDMGLLVVEDLVVLVAKSELLGNPVALPSGVDQGMTNAVELPPSAAGIHNQDTPLGEINEHPILPIRGLTRPSCRGKWAVKGRVTSKGELSPYSSNQGKWNAFSFDLFAREGGEGNLFYFDLIDSQQGEIRFICLADQYYDNVEAGKIYIISQGTLRLPQKDNHLGHKYEIVLDSTSTIQPCLQAEDDSIPMYHFNFRKIREIEGMNDEDAVDIIGIVTSVSSVSTKQKKSGKRIRKRTVRLIDSSSASVEVTLWGKFCDGEGQQLDGKWEANEHPVLAIKTGIVNGFGGSKSVTTVDTSRLVVNPNIPDAELLIKWLSVQVYWQMWVPQYMNRQQGQSSAVDTKSMSSSILSG